MNSTKTNQDSTSLPNYVQVGNSLIILWIWDSLQSNKQPIFLEV